VAGGAISETNTSGKKSVDFQLNLIPCIDLLSVMICFLLLNSMWTKIGKIDVQQQPTLGDSVPAFEDVEKLSLSLAIKSSGYALSKQGTILREIERRDGTYDLQSLTAALGEVAKAHPDNHEITVHAEDRVAYAELIAAMDACLANRLDAITVAGVDY
jgi:biopolymer transport protein TolR